MENREGKRTEGKGMHEKGSAGIGGSEERKVVRGWCSLPNEPKYCSKLIALLIVILFKHYCISYLLHRAECLCLQCFDAVGWVAGRASRPVKTEWWGVGVVIRLERGADLHVGQLMPLPLTISCFSKIQIGFAFLVPAHLGSPGQRAVKRVCVGCA